MKKFVTTLVTTTAAALGLFIAGTTSASADTVYTVKAGDSVWAISQKYDTTIKSIEDLNNIENHLILPGQKLKIDNDGQTTQATTATQSATNYAANSQASSNTASSNYSASTSNSTASTSSSSTSYTGSNMKSYVLSQMSSRTGVSASTWNAIIQRESNWQPSVRNSSSGAYGLFQNMHISGGSVQEQVNAAVSLYKSQGMGAWALN